jgi:asparagine synthase (glutamine-hydrolysing)
MCGLIGVLRQGDWAPPRRPEAIDLAALSLRHRGPDHLGRFDSPDFSLRHLKLEIQDRSVRSHQPLITPNFVIAFNGEIYNFRDLAQAIGMPRAAPRWDGEILVAGYERMGEHLWEKLDGEFAVALFDRKRRSLHLVRDRMGAKPIFIRPGRGETAFASEIAGFRALDDRPLTLNVPRVCNDMIFGPWGPREDSWFEDVQPVAPGAVLTVEAGTIATRRYWHPRRRARPAVAGPGIATSVATAVRGRLVGDCAKAVFVSGGVDSSAVAAAAVGEGVVAYTVDYGDPDRDETLVAARLCRKFGLELRAVPVSASQIGLDVCDRLCMALAEPPQDLVYFATFALYRAAAADGIRAVLTGQGNDELWGGYAREAPMSALAARRREAFHTEALQRLAAAGVARLTGGKLERHSLWNGPWIAAHLSAERDRDAVAVLRTYGRSAPFQSTLRRHLDQEDRLSMAWSVESRLPLLANELVDAAFASRASNEAESYAEKGAFRAALAPTLGPFASAPKRSHPPPPVELATDLTAFALEAIAPVRRSAILNGLLNPSLAERDLYDIVKTSPSLAIRIAGLARFATVWGL